MKLVLQMILVVSVVCLPAQLYAQDQLTDGGEICVNYDEVFEQCIGTLLIVGDAILCCYNAVTDPFFGGGEEEEEFVVPELIIEEGHIVPAPPVPDYYYPPTGNPGTIYR